MASTSPTKTEGAAPTSSAPVLVPPAKKDTNSYGYYHSRNSARKRT